VLGLDLAVNPAGLDEAQLEPIGRLAEPDEHSGILIGRSAISANKLATTPAARSPAPASA
jgi:hypothetical protein